MEAINHNEAIGLIKAALESKAITLGGPASAPTPKAAGERDAQYLIALLMSLKAQQQ